MHSMTKYALKRSEQMLVSQLEHVAEVDPSSKATKSYLDALMLLHYKRSSPKK